MKKYKGYIIGILIGASLMFSFQGFAEDGLTEIKALLRTGLNITLDGKKVELDNPSINYEGSTYIKLRDAGKITGTNVVWNDKTQTVEMTSVGINVTGNVYDDNTNQSNINTPTEKFTPFPNLKSLANIKGVIYNFQQAPTKLFKDMGGEIYATEDLDYLLNIYYNDYSIDATHPSKFAADSISPLNSKIFIDRVIATDKSTNEDYTIDNFYNSDKSKVFSVSKDNNISYYKTIPIVSLDKFFAALNIQITVSIDLNNKTVTYTFNN
jgi:hypothetical protein